MQFQDNPFAGLPQFGSMAGPGGFAGMDGLGGMMGGGMFGAPKKKKGGFPWDMLGGIAAGGLMGGMLGGGMGNMAGLMASPLGFGLYKAFK